MFPLSDYLRPPVCNGHPLEQAMIRRWWHEEHGARGRLVWEYFLGECYADAIWFPELPSVGEECRGNSSMQAFPLKDQPIVVCEAKVRLVPELVGQALVYSVLAREAGAQLRATVIFAETGTPRMEAAAAALGLQVVIASKA